VRAGGRGAGTFKRHRRGVWLHPCPSPNSHRFACLSVTARSLAFNAGQAPRADREGVRDGRGVHSKAPIIGPLEFLGAALNWTKGSASAKSWTFSLITLVAFLYAAALTGIEASKFAAVCGAGRNPGRLERLNVKTNVRGTSWSKAIGAGGSRDKLAGAGLGVGIVGILSKNCTSETDSWSKES
jgi:hypothetical protein